MVVTRSQTRDDNALESTRMSDNESDASFPEALTKEQMIDFVSNDILNRQSNSERNVTGQRFY